MYSFTGQFCGGKNVDVCVCHTQGSAVVNGVLSIVISRYARTAAVVCVVSHKIALIIHEAAEISHTITMIDSVNPLLAAKAQRLCFTVMSPFLVSFPFLFFLSLSFLFLSVFLSFSGG